MFRLALTSYQISTRGVATTPGLCLHPKYDTNLFPLWNPNKLRVLADGPDYTFLDGRPTPYGSKQLQRISKQKELTAKIIEMTSEIDFAVNRHFRLNEEKRLTDQKIIENKLTEKGKKMLNRSHK